MSMRRVPTARGGSTIATTSNKGPMSTRRGRNITTRKGQTKDTAKASDKQGKQGKGERKSFTRVQNLPNAKKMTIICKPVRETDSGEDKVQRPEPLVLYVNPSERATSKNLVFTETRTGGGIKESVWGWDRPVWEFSGSTAAFLHREYGIVNLQHLKRDTTAYQYFKRLLDFYRFNGRITQPRSSVYGHSILLKNHKAILWVEPIMIYYNEYEVQGNFASFNWTRDETKPFANDFTFSFTVESWKHAY